MWQATHHHAVEVDGVSRARLDSSLHVGEVGLPPGEVVVQVDDEGAEAAAADKPVEGLNMVRVQLEKTLRPVPRHLPKNINQNDGQKKIRPGGSTAFAGAKRVATREITATALTRQTCCKAARTVLFLMSTTVRAFIKSMNKIAKAEKMTEHLIQIACRSG